MLELTRTYIYTEPLSNSTGIIEKSKVLSNDDADTIKKAREQLDKEVEEAYSDTLIINFDTVTETIKEVEFDDASTGENAADQANAKDAAEGTSDV